jgi:hypothetical protein
VGASLRIEFGRSFGVFVGLRGCTEKRTTDLLSVASKLDQLRTSGGWNDAYCVITSLVAARSALIGICADRGGALELSASGPMSDILSQLESDLRIASASGVAYRSVITTGCTPLFRLVRLAAADELILRGPTAAGPRLVIVDPQVERVTDGE